MNPEASLPITFGRTRADAARAAVLLALLGSAAVVALERYLTRPQSPLGQALEATGLPPLVPLLVGVAIVLALAVSGYFRSVAQAERYRLTEVGLEVSGSLGSYVLEWDNIREAGATSAGLGINVGNRERVLLTHQGTEQQGELLRTMPRFGKWDFFFTHADIGRPPDQVLRWMQPYLDQRRPGVQ